MRGVDQHIGHPAATLEGNLPTFNLNRCRRWLLHVPKGWPESVIRGLKSKVFQAMPWMHSFLRRFRRTETGNPGRGWPCDKGVVGSRKVTFDPNTLAPWGRAQVSNPRMHLDQI